MYLGPFYINTKELFLIMTAVILGLAIKFGWGLYWFDKRVLLVLVVLLFVTKSVLSTINNEVFFLLAIVSIFLTLYFNLFQIIIFYLVSFTLMRWLKLI